MLQFLIFVLVFSLYFVRFYSVNILYTYNKIRNGSGKNLERTIKIKWKFTFNVLSCVYLSMICLHILNVKPSPSLFSLSFSLSIFPGLDFFYGFLIVPCSYVYWEWERFLHTSKASDWYSAHTKYKFSSTDITVNRTTSEKKENKLISHS